MNLSQKAGIYFQYFWREIEDRSRKDYFKNVI